MFSSHIVKDELRESSFSQLYNSCEDIKKDENTIDNVKVCDVVSFHEIYRVKTEKGQRKVNFTNPLYICFFIKAFLPLFAFNTRLR